MGNLNAFFFLSFLSFEMVIALFLQCIFNALTMIHTKIKGKETLKGAILKFCLDFNGSQTIQFNGIH